MGLCFLVQLDAEALAGAGQLRAVFLLALVEQVSLARPAQPVGPGLFQDGRVHTDFGTGAQPGGVNKSRVGFARLGQGGEELATEGQSRRGGGDDLKTVPPGEAARTLMRSLHKVDGFKLTFVISDEQGPTPAE